MKKITYTTVVLTTLATVLLGIMVATFPRIERAEAVVLPNIIIILTDDQRADTMFAMDKVNQRLRKNGILFTNAFITTPICCPSRASLHSGGFLPQNTQVLTNNLENGGVMRYKDGNTLATKLQAAGYRTALIGKYLNQYDNKMAPTVPPGWTKFIGLKDDSNWNNFSVIVGSSTTATTTGTQVQVTQYMTDYLKNEALAFIDSSSSTPFALFITPKAPHAPATPASGDQNLFNNFTNNAPSVGENNLNDKPQWVKDSADYADANPFARDQLRSLQAVDRLVDAVFQRVNLYNLVPQTHFVYTSDNGFLWGEHGIQRKAKAYEESIRVPLIVRSPDIPVKPATSTLDVAVNLDLGRTVLSWAGIVTTTDGFDLRPILQGTQATSTWPREQGIIFQHYGQESTERYNPPLWVAWRTKFYKLVEYPTTGEKEFYDLVSDPYEMVSKHNNAGFAAIISQYSTNIAANKGMISPLATSTLPVGQAGVAYSFQFPVTGGVAPYTWSPYDNKQPPPGLSINSSGLLSGTPTQTGTWTFDVEVRDSSVSLQHGGPQSFIAEKNVLTINP